MKQTSQYTMSQILVFLYIFFTQVVGRWFENISIYVYILSNMDQNKFSPMKITYKDCSPADISTMIYIMYSTINHHVPVALF